MNKYCIAYISFFDNILKQEVIETDATELRDVLYDYMWDTLGYRGIERKSYEDLQSFAYDCDAMISVIKI